MPVCPKCGNQPGAGAVFCDQCGARLPAADAASAEQVPTPAAASVICTACGAGNVPGEAYCDFCGSPLEQPLPTAEAEAGQESESDEAAGEEAPAPADAGVPPEGDSPNCPVCGAAVQPGEAFCPDCGASLAQAPLPPEPVLEEEHQRAQEAEVETEQEVAPAAVEAEEAESEIPVQAAVIADEEDKLEPAPATLIVEAEPKPATCPACGIEVDAADKFCSNCGAVLVETPPADETPRAKASAGPCLMVVSSGAEIPLPAKEELLIGREDPISGIYPEVDLTPHGGEEGGVSRRHARLVFEGGKAFVEDLDSTNYTFVNRQKLVPRTRHPLNDGDELRCGRVALRFSE